MRKAISLLLVLCIVLALCGCGSTKKAFEISKDAYNEISAAYQITEELGHDLYSGIHVAIYGSDAVKGSNVLENLSEECIYISREELKAGLSYSLATYKYEESWDDLSDEEKDKYFELAEIYDFSDEHISENQRFIACWTVIHAYELNGSVAKAYACLESAKVLMRELSDKYSDYEHYPNLKGFYTTTNSYLDAIETFKMSFEAYKDLHTQYEKEARDYKADLDYIFED